MYFPVVVALQSGVPTRNSIPTILYYTIYYEEGEEFHFLVTYLMSRGRGSG